MRVKEGIALIGAAPQHSGDDFKHDIFTELINRERLSISGLVQITAT